MATENSNSNAERDDNFEVAVGFDGLEEPNDNLWIPLVKKGVFQVCVEDAYANQSKAGNSRMVLKLSVIADPQAENGGSTVGHTVTTGLNVPKSQDDPVRYYWRALFLSLGFDPDKPGARFNRTMLVGKKGHIYFAPKARNGYDDCKFLTPEGYDKQKTVRFEQASSASGGNASTTQSNPYGSGNSSDAPGESAEDLMRRLKNKSNGGGASVPPPPGLDEDIPF